MQIRHQKFSKKELFVGQRYRRTYDQKPWPGLALNEEFLKGERLNQKLKIKIFELGDVCKQTSLLKRIADRGLGPKPQLLGNCFTIFGKKSYFNAIGSHFVGVQEPFERTRFLTLESRLKKIKLFQTSFYL